MCDLPVQTNSKWMQDVMRGQLGAFSGRRALGEPRSCHLRPAADGQYQSLAVDAQFAIQRTSGPTNSFTVAITGPICPTVQFEKLAVPQMSSRWRVVIVTGAR